MATPDRTKPVVPAKGPLAIKGSTWNAVSADVNCEVAYSIVSAGTAVLAAASSAASKQDAAHLQPFVDAVKAESATDEHAFMAFNLSDDALESLRAALAAYRLDDR